MTYDKFPTLVSEFEESLDETEEEETTEPEKEGADSDKDLEEETRTWTEIKEVIDRNGYDLRVRLTDGIPDMYLEKA